ncbi:Plasmodium exported protein (PHISTa), unknown, putative [Plasmodium sp. DRC-Itaito]|nr:Plasmodium exported protein (PHISTa), unknown, putative [Plasmodium sp. DRC-Itaito]
MFAFGIIFLHININVIIIFGGNKPICRNAKYPTWEKSIYDIVVALSCKNVEHTLNFYKLVKDQTSIDEMKNCIYAFIKYYDTLKIDLFNEHKTIFTEKMKNTQCFDI